MNTINIAVILLILMAFGRTVTKKWLNPLSIFFAIWAVITFCSSLDINRLPKMNPEYYFYIFIGCLSYFFGFMIPFLSFNKLTSKKIRNKTRSINFKFAEIVALVCIIYLFSNFYLRGASISNVLDLAGTQERLMSMDSNSGLINTLGLLIINPLYIVIDLLACLDFWSKDRHKFLFFENIILVVGRIILSGGRQAIVEFFIFFIVSYSLSTYKISLKKKTTIILLFSLSLVLFFLLSSLRSDNVQKSLLLDLSIEPNMFQYWGEVVAGIGIYGYGASSLMGFLYVPFYIIKNLGLITAIPNTIQNIYLLNQQTDSQWINLGDTVNANAYVSVFWNLFLDGRIYGIIIGMFTFGIISFYLFKKVNNGNTDLLSTAYYMLLIYFLAYSFGDSELSKINFCLSIVYVIFFLKKEGIINVKEDKKSY